MALRAKGKAEQANMVKTSYLRVLSVYLCVSLSNLGLVMCFVPKGP